MSGDSRVYMYVNDTADVTLVVTRYMYKLYNLEVARL